MWWPHDGSTQDIDLVMVDGLANLPTVAEGAAYTEAVTGDARESMSFGKRGVYVGITLEMFRRSDIAKMQAIPRELVKAAIRTRSAAIAGIFTAASGAGPTMVDDSTALFHANHGNLATVAFSAAEWAAARKRLFARPCRAPAPSWACGPPLRCCRWTSTTRRSRSLATAPATWASRTRAARRRR